MYENFGEPGMLYVNKIKLLKMGVFEGQKSSLRTNAEWEIFTKRVKWENNYFVYTYLIFLNVILKSIPHNSRFDGQN